MEPVSKTFPFGNLTQIIRFRNFQRGSGVGACHSGPEIRGSSLASLGLRRGVREVVDPIKMRGRGVPTLVPARFGSAGSVSALAEVGRGKISRF